MTEQEYQEYLEAEKIYEEELEKINKEFRPFKDKLDKSLDKFLNDLEDLELYEYDVHDLLEYDSRHYREDSIHLVYENYYDRCVVEEIRFPIWILWRPEEYLVEKSLLAQKRKAEELERVQKAKARDKENMYLKYLELKELFENDNT